jgi:hypothetical protein
MLSPIVETGDPIKDDFRNFLFLVWQHLGLPDPTPAQYEVARFLQMGLGNPLADGAGRRDILMGFRGVGKSYITAAFVLWLLLRDPVNEKILVVSASSVKAKEFVSQAKTIMMTMPMLAHLRPRADQRDMADRFDVNGASISQSPSVKAAGITGQITGSRATRIIADDIEVPENSKTEDSREGLMRTTSEFEAIILPGGDVFFLGTPQTEESIYIRKIEEQGYECFCWPARFPRPEKRESYILTRSDGVVVDILAPVLRDALDADAKLAGKATDPQRFDDDELARRESKGRAFFALQYMLDTSLSDAERYPLKAFDLIVFNVNNTKAPSTIQWGRDSNAKNILKHIPNFGFSGDYCLGPLFWDDEWRPYEASLLFVDPSGRGKDETAWAIVKVLNGTFYVVKIGGFAGDPAKAMELIATDARDHNVHEVVVEPNFAGIIWINAFQPILARIWPTGCTVRESEWAKGQKEARIIDTVEPVLTAHRLVVDESVAKDETLMYQLTHITRDRGALKHDDRLDALAGALAEFSRVLMQDQEQQAKAAKNAELEAELEQFVEDMREAPTRFFQRVVRSRKDTQGRLYRTVDREAESYTTRV